MAEARPVRGVLVAHGEMARGMADAVRRIAGADADALVPVSNEDVSADHLAERLEELLGEGPGIVFTDLRTGSCAFAARFASKDRPERAIIFGVNLPLLIDFVFHRELSIEELVPRLLEKGRAELCSAPEPAPHGDRALSGR